MPKPKYNPDTVKRLISVLFKNPDGVWLSRLSRLSGVPLSTTSYYLNNQIRVLVDERTVGGEKPLVRVISLKPRVLEGLSEGKSVSSLLKLMKLIYE